MDSDQQNGRISRRLHSKNFFEDKDSGEGEWGNRISESGEHSAVPGSRFKGNEEEVVQQCGAESGSEQTQYVVDRKERENKFMLGMRQPDCYWKKRKISYCRKQKREMRRKELT